MGIYDRDYYQEEERGRWGGFSARGGRSMVVSLILLNVAVYVCELLGGDQVADTLALHSDVFQRPWLVWQFITYGFVHDPHDLTHIIFNMVGLYVFGTDVEAVYGKAEFLRVYFTSIVVAGLAWAITAAAGGGLQQLVGASGGVMCLMILFVLHFPRRLLYIWGIIPVPAWALGTIFVLFDIFGLGSGDLVAHVAHLAGIVFGAIYFRTGINLGRLLPSKFSPKSFRWKPRLKVHNPDDEVRDLNRQVDQILEKISREGEASLSKSERKTLAEASRRYQRRRE